MEWQWLNLKLLLAAEEYRNGNMKADSALFYGLRRSKRKWQFYVQADNICTLMSVKKSTFYSRRGRYGYVAFEIPKQYNTVNFMEIEKLLMFFSVLS